MKQLLIKNTKPLRYTKAVLLVGTLSLAGKIIAEETASKEAPAADQPDYVKRGPYAGGEKKPAECDHKLHLPLLVPKAVYDLKDYCGGGISLF